MKSVELERARAQEAGAAAYYGGKWYTDNPYPGHEPDLRLSWSQGFNGARANHTVRMREDA